MTNGIEHVIHRSATKRLNEQFHAEECIVATSADTETDDVYVKLPNSEQPALRVKVHWRVQVGVDDVGNVVPRWPHRNDLGVVIHMDTGEKWLIY